MVNDLYAEDSEIVLPAESGPSRNVALSIIDSSVANYATCGALFAFPVHPASDTVLGHDAVQASLAQVLSRYAHFAGRLYLSEYDPAIGRTDHTRRYGRVWVEYGAGLSEGGRGVRLISVQHTRSLREAFPSPDDPSAGWHNFTSIGRQAMVPVDRLVKLRADPPDATSTNMIVKVTRYTCGGVVIAVGLHHCLSDAITLELFMQDWATVHRCLLAGHDWRDAVPERPFEPWKLDACAKGDIDGSSEDDMIKGEAMDIPQLRYDLWASGRGKPSFWTLPLEPPLELREEDRSLGEQRGRPLEWDTWDAMAPLKECLICFSPDELQRIWEMAQDTNGPADGGNRPSRLDALLAHLWRLITRARGLADGDINLNITLGLRSRLGPSVSPTFLGSPVINVSGTLPVSAFSSTSAAESLPLAASVCRRVVTDSTLRVPALLHHYAFALDPTREWNALMGDRHLMVTSWLGTSFDKVDFGTGNPWMWPDMPAVDGLVNIIDAAPPGPISQQENLDVEAEPVTETRWYHHGVGVRVVLKVDVMDRLLADPELRL